MSLKVGLLIILILKAQQGPSVVRGEFIGLYHGPQVLIVHLRGLLIL